MGAAPVKTIRGHSARICRDCFALFQDQSGLTISSRADGVDWSRKKSDEIVTCSLDKTFKVSPNGSRSFQTFNITHARNLTVLVAERYDESDVIHDDSFADLESSLVTLRRWCPHFTTTQRSRLEHLGRRAVEERRRYGGTGSEVRRGERRCERVCLESSRCDRPRFWSAQLHFFMLFVEITNITVNW